MLALVYELTDVDRTCLRSPESPCPPEFCSQANAMNTNWSLKIN